ncbi:MAG: HAMP domain-containing histidine kinase [Anaerolineae bacterium]|nr:HAMP domain-containing histidine kinase [Anaerolineae bacterium]
MFAQLRWKLVAAFGALILLAVLLSSLIAVQATENRFEVLITHEGQTWVEDIAPILEESYAYWGNWSGVRQLVTEQVSTPRRLFVSTWQSDCDWWQVVADELGVDKATLTGLWHQLNSLTTIAEEHGIDPETLVAAIVEAERVAAAQAVEAGMLAEQDAVLHLAQVEKTARQFVQLSVQIVLTQTEAQWDQVTAITLDVSPEQIRTARSGGPMVVTLAQERNVAPDVLVSTLIQTQKGIWIVDRIPISGTEPSGRLDAVAVSAWSYVNPAELPPVVWQSGPAMLTQDGAIWMLNTLLTGDRHLLVADPEGTVVFDSRYERIGDRLSENTLAFGMPLYHPADGQRIGTATAAAGVKVYNVQQTSFLRTVNLSLTISGLVGGGAALLVGLLIARQVTQPVTALTVAANRMAEGDLEYRVPIRAKGELGQMGIAFNTMADRLQEQRALRNRLVDDIAHELNTPLSVIQLELEALQDGMQSPQEANERIKKEIALLRELISDLGTLAEADEGTFRLTIAPVDLAALVAQAVRRWQGQAMANGIVLAAQCAGSLPEIQGDVRRLNQVLGNLLTNALQHTPPDGRIEVRCEVAAPVPGDSEMAPAGVDRCIVITVTDTGDGIGPDDVPHIFDRFYRVDRSRNRNTGGRGLGLTIVKQIVEAHGGKVWVESTPGQGSTFGFSLPITSDG